MTVKAKWYAIRKKAAIAAATMGALAAAEILIYGDIGESWWDDTVTARDFVKEINALDADKITVRINSVGGSVPDGLAIHNAIKRHKAEVTVEIDGMAFSIASLIAMAGDKVHMASNAMLMIHAPWSYAVGNSKELRELADQLDTWAAAMATSYVGKTGRPQAEMLELVSDGKDHYYTAEEALAGKFIDGISDAVPPSSMAATAQFAMGSRFRDVPAAFMQACGSAAAPAAASSVASATQTQEPDMKIARLSSVLAAALLMTAAGEHGAPAGGGGGTAPPAPGAGPQPLTDAQRAEVLAADRTRRAGIAAQFKPFMQREGAQALLQQLQDDNAVTEDVARARLLTFLGTGTEPVAGGRIVTVEAEADKIRNAQVNVLLARQGVRAADGKVIVADGSNPFRGSTLLDLAKASLARAGIKTDGMDKMQIVGMSFTQTSSDFPILLETTMHKTLQAAYALQPLTWRKWAKKGSVSDFRAHPRYRRGSFGALDPVNQAGEFRMKAIPDGEKASITAATKGNLVNITRQAIINDDLDAFLGIANDLGMAAARTVEIDAIAVLTANAALIQDGVALFHATHANIGSAGPISVTVFDEARQLMAKQTNVGGNDYLDLRPAVLLCPVALGGQARVINDAQFDPDTVNKLQRPNMVRGLFSEVIDTPRLAGTTWYALADKDICPTVEVGFLDGNDNPFLDQQQGWSVDGTQWKVRLDYGTAAMDFRGAVRGPGA